MKGDVISNYTLVTLTVDSERISNNINLDGQITLEYYEYVQFNTTAHNRWISQSMVNNAMMHSSNYFN